MTLFGDIPFLQDALYYEQVGYSIATAWLNGEPAFYLEVARERQLPIFTIVAIACFYTLTGGIQALPVLIIIYGLITAFTPGLVYRIGREMGATSRAARMSAWLVALLPCFVFFSGALHKEGLILLLLSLGMYHALRLQQGWTGRSFAILSLALLGLIGLRLYLAVIMVFVFAFALLFSRPSRRRGVQQNELATRQVLILLLLTVVTAIGAVIAQEAWPESLPVGFEGLHQWRHNSANFADSGYLPDADISTPAKAVSFLPIGLLYYLTVPWPWQFGSLRQNLAIPDTALWLALYPFVVVGMLHTLRRNFRAATMLIVSIGALSFFYALYVGNIGTAYRMRIQVWLLMAIFAGIGWQVFRGRPAFIRRGAGCKLQGARRKKVSGARFEVRGDGTREQGASNAQMTNDAALGRESRDESREAEESGIID